ncbi:hypothetical protein BC826DRAFT_1099692 [Russula brevipes]|nr:hypothetical protein BC826DRAFT_1099692 [Russula brevipes]
MADCCVRHYLGVPKFGSSEAQTARRERCTTIANSGIVSYLVKGSISPYNKPVRTYPHSIQFCSNALPDPHVFEDRLTSASLLEKHSANRTFLETERITLADITLAAELQHAFTTTVSATLRVKLPNVLRDFENIVNQPNLTSIFDSTTFAEKAPQYTPPSKEKKEKSPAAPAQPKAEREPKKEEVDDEDDDKPYEEAPKENFDKECYSLWRVDFKYNEELTQTFMSSNQIGGFFNRLEASRKYLFGSVGVLGTANNSIIAGALIAHGQEIRPVVEVAPDWESYTYERIDLDNAEQKAFFEAALAWDLEVRDKKWVDGKNPFVCVSTTSACVISPVGVSLN